MSCCSRYPSLSLISSMLVFIYSPTLLFSNSFPSCLCFSVVPRDLLLETPWIPKSLNQTQTILMKSVCSWSSLMCRRVCVYSRRRLFFEINVLTVLPLPSFRSYGWASWIRGLGITGPINKGRSLICVIDCARVNRWRLQISCSGRHASHQRCEVTQGKDSKCELKRLYR